MQELQSKNKDNEQKVNELQKKIILVQNNLLLKKTQWTREKEEYFKNLKTQEALLQKLILHRKQGGYLH